jgi:hypothetical protein
LCVLRTKIDDEYVVAVISHLTSVEDDFDALEFLEI